MRFSLLILLTLALHCLDSYAMPEQPLRPISLQLLWKHQFQFAGYYAAQEMGYYRQAGLDVTFREANPEQDTIEEVLKGQSDFGVGSSDLLLYRAKGKPVIALAVIFQHSPLALVALESSGIHNIHQIAGKRVMIERHASELFAYLKREGIPIQQSQMQFFPHSFGMEELLTDKVDAMSAYITDEPYILAKKGLDYSVFSPRSAGIDFYGDNLFTSESFLQAHPNVVSAFREASLRGWEYAMTHPEEMADLIIARYGNRKSKEQLLFEYTQMVPLLRPDLVAIGYMYPGRWQHIADVYNELGMLQDEFPVEDFLYNPNDLHIPIWVFWAAGGIIGFSLLAGGVAFYILRINRRLSREIAQRKKTELSLRASEQHYQIIYESAPLALIVFDRENRVVDWNNAAEAIFGWPRLDMLGQTLERIVSEPDRNYVLKVMEQAWAGGVVTGSNHNLTREGRTILCRWSNVAQKDGNGNTIGVLSLAEDITETQKMRDEIEAANQSLRTQIKQIQSLQDELREQALHDPLTNLFNRRYFHELLERELAQCERDSKPLSLVMIDIDYFKQINDSFGHQTGDRVLVALADILRSSTRSGDSVFRFGGEEFVIILPGMDAEIGMERAESLRRIFAELMIHTEDGDAKTTLSAGIATWPTHALDAKRLLSKADKALYAAKEAGRNRILVAE
jgi:diguanylate cyclase (GGDEF)-like protein/PAS domain S-box-containing protein